MDTQTYARTTSTLALARTIRIALRSGDPGAATYSYLLLREHMDPERAFTLLRRMVRRFYRP